MCELPSAHQRSTGRLTLSPSISIDRAPAFDWISMRYSWIQTAVTVFGPSIMRVPVGKAPAKSPVHPSKPYRSDRPPAGAKAEIETILPSGCHPEPGFRVNPEPDGTEF